MTDDEIMATIVAMRQARNAEGRPLYTWRQIAAAVGLTREQARDRYRYRLNKSGGKSTPETPEPDEDETEQADPGEAEAIASFNDKKAVNAPDWRDLLRTASDVQAINDRVEDTQRVASITVTTKQPIHVIFSGDWHLGSLATDYDTWRKHIELVLSKPTVYLVVLGDVTENMRSFKNLSAVLNQALSPRLQGYMLRSVIDELARNNKLLAMVRGNHDEFDERSFGDVLQRYLLEQVKAPMFSNRGLVKIRVGNDIDGWATYTMLLFHKSRFRSFMRPTHGAYREMQLSYPADIIAGAHDHQWGIEVFENYSLAREIGAEIGGRTFLIKTGTFSDTPYGWRFFHNGGQPLTPAVSLWPHKRKMTLILDPLEDI